MRPIVHCSDPFSPKSCSCISQKPLSSRVVRLLCIDLSSEQKLLEKNLVIQALIQDLKVSSEISPRGHQRSQLFVKHTERTFSRCKSQMLVSLLTSWDAGLCQVLTRWQGTCLGCSTCQSRYSKTDLTKNMLFRIWQQMPTEHRAWTKQVPQALQKLFHSQAVLAIMLSKTTSGVELIPSCRGMQIAWPSCRASTSPCLCWEEAATQ